MSDISRSDVKKIFKKFDTNGNDTLSWDEFCAMTDELDGEVALEEKSRVFDEADANHTGMISFEEFYKWWVVRVS